MASYDQGSAMHETVIQIVRLYQPIACVILKETYTNDSLLRPTQASGVANSIPLDDLCDHIQRENSNWSKKRLREVVAALDRYGLVTLTRPNPKLQVVRRTVVGEYWMTHSVPELALDYDPDAVIDP